MSASYSEIMNTRKNYDKVTLGSSGPDGGWLLKVLEIPVYCDYLVYIDITLYDLLWLVLVVMHCMMGLGWIVQDMYLDNFKVGM